MKNWREALIPANSSIRDCLSIIDRAALKIGFVCDENQRLLGTVSDGDIRRGLLADTELGDPVSSVLNNSPKTCLESASRTDMLELLSKYEVEVLPVLNELGVLKNVVTFDILHKPVRKDNPIFIMAGGFGTRLRPLTDSCPKPMLPVGDKPLLEHIIIRFKEQGFWNFYVSTHYLPHVIVNHFGDGSDFGVSIQYVDEEVPLGTGGALSLLPDDISSLPLILMNGDVLTDLSFEDILSTHMRLKADATMCLREHETAVAYGVVTVRNNLVTEMLEKPVYRYLINTGIYVLSRDLIIGCKSEGKIDLPTILERRIESGKTIAAHRFHGEWIDIGKLADYERATRAIFDGK